MRILLFLILFTAYSFSIFAAENYHPADTNKDWKISRQEFDAFNDAWFIDDLWPGLDGLIDKDYVTRAGYIVKKGGLYEYTDDSEPLCWNYVYDQITNSIGMTFTYIPEGTFTMGSPPNEPCRNSDEDQHTVIISKAYYMQTTEVTQRQWKEIMGNNPSLIKECDNCPVERVSWHDTQSFIQKLNQKEGVSIYRLPTEAEWEYAARAGATSALVNGGIRDNCIVCIFPEKDIIPDINLSVMGWYCANSYSQHSSYDRSEHPVAQLQANDWGIYDIHGNVAEWCQDWYNSKYPSGTVTDPTGPDLGSSHVFRGGHYRNDPRHCRLAARSYNSLDNPEYVIGFRLVRFQSQ